jgi:hypothetical protein
MTTDDYINNWQDNVNKQNELAKSNINWSVMNSTTLFDQEELYKYTTSRKQATYITDYPSKIAFFSLIYKNENEQWLRDLILSQLWQLAYFKYEMTLIYVLDPPFQKTKMIIERILDEYEEAFEFEYKIICNQERQGWCGSYNQALDCCAEIGIDIVMVSDSDDINHPERMLWTYNILNSDPTRKCVTFVPYVFEEGKDIFEHGWINNWHPCIFHDPAMVFVESCLLWNDKGNSLSAFNPNVVGLSKDAIETVRFRKDIVDNDANIIPADQLFIYEILRIFPFGCYQDDRIMQLYRKHHNNLSVKKNSPDKWHNVLMWKQRIAKEIKLSLFEKYNTEYIEDILNHCKDRYNLELPLELFRV